MTTSLLYRIVPLLINFVPSLFALIYMKKQEDDKWFSKIASVEVPIATITTYVLIEITIQIANKVYESISIEFVKTIKPQICFFVLAIFICLFLIHILVVSYICFFTMPKNKINTDNTENNRYSIKTIITEAEKNRCWNEVIFIGEALSEFLWYTGRKELRVWVGNHLKNAATQKNDLNCKARTLIEDIGITNYIIGEKNKGIGNIYKGIKLAEVTKNNFLLCRAYRHLSCCNIKEGRIEEAKGYYNTACEYYKYITDKYQKMEAGVSLEYAKMKFLMQEGDFVNTLTSIDECIRIYSEIAKKYPDKTRHNNDRIAKMHRQKGHVYGKMNNHEMAEHFFHDSLMKSQEQDNHENIVLCCIELIKIIRNNDEVSPEEMTYINTAKLSIPFVDSKTVKKTFFNLIKEKE